jgi:hypothetical protein
MICINKTSERIRLFMDGTGESMLPMLINEGVDASGYVGERYAEALRQYGKNNVTFECIVRAV